jgi:hypothetical protein
MKNEKRRMKNEKWRMKGEAAERAVGIPRG